MEASCSPSLASTHVNREKKEKRRRPVPSKRGRKRTNKNTKKKPIKPIKPKGGVVSLAISSLERAVLFASVPQIWRGKRKAFLVFGNFSGLTHPSLTTHSATGALFFVLLVVVVCLCGWTTQKGNSVGYSRAHYEAAAGTSCAFRASVLLKPANNCTTLLGW
jgi:hypothetical protein